MKIGVLGLQGDVREHIRMLQLLGVESLIVKLPEDLSLVDGLIIPGGESTTMIRIMKEIEMYEPLKEKIEEGFPVFGTCAGMILLSKKVEGSDQLTLKVLDIEVERNAYGRQIESFEVDIKVPQFGDKPVRAVFIRAPKIVKAGNEVEALAEYEGTPVFVRENNVMATSFHPELTDDARVHEYFIKIVGEFKK
ncbi:MAG: pyridoxal 5'-phosphate synthase glutaminase subunit PdxT [Thermotogaceae bacterium]|nr:pyridoxal 5'-phosphate synthase glutaminase subunit PdxT [Thermotogaceae bacterium]